MTEDLPERLLKKLELYLEEIAVFWIRCPRVTIYCNFNWSPLYLLVLYTWMAINDTRP